MCFFLRVYILIAIDGVETVFQLFNTFYFLPLTIFILFPLISRTPCLFCSLPLSSWGSLPPLSSRKPPFPFIPIFSDETMLLLQILSFGGLLKCGLISEWRGGVEGGSKEEEEEEEG